VRVAARWPAALLVVLAATGAARAEAAPVPDPACLLTAIEARAEAQAAFQAGLADLIAEETPEHAALARIAEALQVALMERRVRRWAFLLDADPRAVTVPEDVQDLIWTEDAEARLLATDAAYAGLQDEIEALGAQNNAHPGWPGLRRAYGEAIAPSAAHGRLVERFEADIAAAYDALAACFMPAVPPQ